MSVSTLQELDFHIFLRDSFCRVPGEPTRWFLFSFLCLHHLVAQPLTYWAHGYLIDKFLKVAGRQMIDCQREGVSLQDNASEDVGRLTKKLFLLYMVSSFSFLRLVFRRARKGP